MTEVNVVKTSQNCVKRLMETVTRNAQLKKISEFFSS